MVEVKNAHSLNHSLLSAISTSSYKPKGEGGERGSRGTLLGLPVKKKDGGGVGARAVKNP